MPPRVLLTGLPPYHPQVLTHSDPSVIAAGLEAAQSAVRSAGYAFTFRPYSPGPESLASFVHELQATEWDGVCIGMGVRGDKDLTPWFEELIWAVRQHAPQARLCFNTSPETSLEAFKRAVPLQSGEAN